MSCVQAFNTLHWIKISVLYNRSTYILRFRLNQIGYTNNYPMLLKVYWQIPRMVFRLYCLPVDWCIVWKHRRRAWLIHFVSFLMLFFFLLFEYSMPLPLLFFYIIKYKKYTLQVIYCVLNDFLFLYLWFFLSSWRV